MTLNFTAQAKMGFGPPYTSESGPGLCTLGNTTYAMWRTTDDTIHWQEFNNKDEWVNLRGPIPGAGTSYRPSLNANTFPNGSPLGGFIFAAWKASPVKGTSDQEWMHTAFLKPGTDTWIDRGFIPVYGSQEGPNAGS